MNSDDQELWEVANAILNDKKISLKINPKNRWLYIQGGVFVTGYRDVLPSNENVNCCMSNGRYQTGSVAENLIESAKICRTDDGRWKKGSQIKETEITILKPKDKWRVVTNIERSRNRSIAMETKLGHFALFLPSVWNEEKNWSSNKLIQELLRKASDGSVDEVKTIYEIDNYIINRSGSKNVRYFRNGGSQLSNIDEDKKEILENIYNFYVDNADMKNHELAYMIDEKGNKQYLNQTDNLVRSYFDVGSFYRLAKYLKKDIKILEVMFAHYFSLFVGRMLS